MLSRSLNRILVLGLALTLAACDALPIPQISFATRTPLPATGVPATPLPSGLINFNVRTPPNTPVNAGVAVELMDEITGNRTLVPMSSAGNNVWTASAPATQNDVLRYRYIRTAPTYAFEVTPVLQPVSYRLFIATEPNATASDSVAAWNDLGWPGGDQGALTGFIRNSNTGLGVGGVLVSGAGQLMLTASDGSYAFYNVPAGNQRVTYLAPDGSLRAAQNSVNVPASQTALLDLASPDPNALHVTFYMTPPAGTDALAAIRLIGNVAQLGNTFAIGPTGSAISAARAPVLTPANDGTGRFQARVLLYEGTVLRYAYTLGDGYWNNEIAAGARRVRQLIVPFSDSVTNDVVADWHTGTSSAVTFEAVTPPSTPANDVLAIQFRTADQWLPPLPMWRAALNTWRYKLENPVNFNGPVYYRYCRNLACGSADDAATAGVTAIGRSFTPTLFPQTLKDNINEWRWSAPPPPVNLELPPPAPRPGFMAGLDLAETWQPYAAQFYPETIRNAQVIAANTLTIFRRVRVRNLTPPVLADDPALTMPAEEVRQLVGQINAANLRATLHPLTCDYVPYGGCEFWAGFNPAWWNDWYAAYERHMLTQADLAQTTGVDTLVIGDYRLQPSLPGEPGAPPDADTRWRTLLARVRERFKGRLAFELLLTGTNDLWPNPPQFLDSVDVIRVHWWAKLADINGRPLADMTVNAGNVLDFRLLPVQQRFGKPLLISLAYTSADGWSTQCIPAPDRPCRDVRDFNPDSPDVPSVALDLNEQAETYQAVFSAAYSRPWVTGISAFGYNPVVALRDKSLSVRGKPAEALVGAWFLRLQGR